MEGAEGMAMKFHGNVRGEGRVNLLALFASKPHVFKCGALEFKVPQKEVSKRSSITYFFGGVTFGNFFWAILALLSLSCHFFARLFLFAGLLLVNCSELFFAIPSLFWFPEISNFCGIIPDPRSDDV